MRNAFTMIELIFAIMIIAISIMSLPMMMRVNDNAIEGNIVQEALFASSAKMEQVLSYPWDHHDVDSTDSGAYTKVVNVTTGDSSYARKDINGTVDNGSNYRIGHVRENGHRRFHSNSSVDANVTTTITNGGSTGLDNISNSNIPFDNPSTSATGYKKTYSMNVNVGYISDTGSPFVFSNTSSNIPTNMKLIEISISDTSGPLVLLRSYSANIGEIDFAKRRF